MPSILRFACAFSAKPFHQSRRLRRVYKPFFSSLRYDALLLAKYAPAIGRETSLVPSLQNLYVEPPILFGLILLQGHQMSELDGLFQTAMQSHVAGEFTAAAGGYAKVLMKDPTHADAWHLAGLLAHQNGRSADGLKQIQMAIELNSTNPEYFSNLAAIFNKLKRPEEALKAAEQALAIDSSFGPADFQKGIACSLLDRMDDALQSLEQSYESGFANQAVLREIGENETVPRRHAGCTKKISRIRLQ